MTLFPAAKGRPDFRTYVFQHRIYYYSEVYIIESYKCYNWYNV